MRPTPHAVRCRSPGPLWHHGPVTASASPGGTSTPRVLADRYRLDSVIGKGSMGTVWAATDLVLHRNVAIKEIDFPPGTPAAERSPATHLTDRRPARTARHLPDTRRPRIGRSPVTGPWDPGGHRWPPGARTRVEP